MKQLNKNNIDDIEKFSSHSREVKSDGEYYVLKSASVETTEEAERIAEDLRGKLSEEFTIWSDGTSVFLAREFIDGNSLLPKIDSPEEALSVIAEIAKKLGGRIHGNLKPENIIQNRDGNFVIVDSRCRDFYRLALKSEGPGTEYLTPEQIRGEVSEKSDVYALGMLLGKVLCGNTPFDGKSEDTVLQEKQQSAPSWDILQDCPDEIKKIVTKATANNAIFRHQSVAEFEEDCRRAMRLLSGGGTALPPSEPQPSVENNVPLNPNKRFVLVGHTGAGKTVLAGGLYATFSRSKSLSVEAADETTKQFANNFKSNLETGTWPAATTGAAQKLCFRIANNGDAAELDFDEYMGERVSDVESYIRDILKEPNGVLLLMNPGGLQFRLKSGVDDTPQELAVRRNKLLSDLKSIIDYLFKLKTRPSVALVITASDRLKTDLKDFEPEFNRYVEEIETALDTRDKNWWKRFEVSVCGELADQTRPKLNPQGIEDPFLWLTERYNTVVRKKRITKFFVQTVCGLSALALSAAAWWGVDWYRASVPEKETRACIAEFSGKNTIKDLGNCVQKLVGIRRGYCTENHITENHGKRVSACRKTCSPFFLYPDRKREFEKNIKDLEIAIDATRASYYEGKVHLALEKATEENCKVAEDVAGWIPLQASEIEKRFDKLKIACEKEIPVARERRVYSEIARRLDEIIKMPSVKGIPKALVEEVDAFCASSPAGTKEAHNRLSEDLRHKRFNAKCACERYAFSSLAQKLNEVCEKPESGLLAELVKLVKTQCATDSVLPQGEHGALVADLNQKLSQARDSVFKHNAEKLCAALKEQNPHKIDDLIPIVKKWNLFKAQQNDGVQKVLVDKYQKAVADLVILKNWNVLDELCAAHRTRQLKTEEQVTPYFEAEWRKKILPLAPEFKTNHEGFLVQKLQKIDSEWREWCKTQVQEKVKTWENASSNVVGTIRGLKVYLLEHAENPWIVIAEQFVHDIAFRQLNAMMGNWKGTETEYIDLKKICAAIKSTDSNFIKESKLYRFADFYLDWRDKYSRRVSITAKRHERVDGKLGKKFIEKISSLEGAVLMEFNEKTKERECVYLLKAPWGMKLHYSVGRNARPDDHERDDYSGNYEKIGMLKAGESAIYREHQLDITMTALSEKTVRELYDEVFN